MLEMNIPTFCQGKNKTRLNTHSVPAAGQYYSNCKCRLKGPKKLRAPKGQKSLILSKETPKEPSKESSKEPSKELSKEPYKKPSKEP